MKAATKAKITFKKTFLKSVERDKNKYLALASKYPKDDANRIYYTYCADKCDIIIEKIKREIEEIEFEHDISRVIGVSCDT